MEQKGFNSRIRRTSGTFFSRVEELVLEIPQRMTHGSLDEKKLLKIQFLNRCFK